MDCTCTTQIICPACQARIAAEPPAPTVDLNLMFACVDYKIATEAEVRAAVAAGDTAQLATWVQQVTAAEAAWEAGRPARIVAAEAAYQAAVDAHQRNRKPSEFGRTERALSNARKALRDAKDD